MLMPGLADQEEKEQIAAALITDDNRRWDSDQFSINDGANRVVTCVHLSSSYYSFSPPQNTCFP
jgi:hypothetical protein